VQFKAIGFPALQNPFGFNEKINLIVKILDEKLFDIPGDQTRPGA
jgi:hypothetical protein